MNFNFNNEEGEDENKDQDDNQNDNESENESENDGEREGDGEKESKEGSNERQPETPEAKRARLKRELDRHNKKYPPKEDKEGTEDDSEEGKKVEDDRYNRLELKTEGITDKKEQDAVIEYAKFKKIPVLEALKKPALQAELREIRDKSSTPAPSSRTNQNNKSDDVDYWVDQYKNHGKKVPENIWPKVRKKIRGH